MSDVIHIVCPHCHRSNRVPTTRLQDKSSCGKCKQTLFNGKPVELTSEHFFKHINNSDIPIVVDFWAPWCGPCKMMAPIFKQAAQQFQTAVRLVKVNTEVEQSIAAQYRIQSIPTLVIFKNSNEVARTAGAMDLSSLLRWLQQHL